MERLCFKLAIVIPTTKVALTVPNLYWTIVICKLKEQRKYQKINWLHVGLSSDQVSSDWHTLVSGPAREYSELQLNDADVTAPFVE